MTMRYLILLAVPLNACSVDTTDLWCAANYDIYRFVANGCELERDCRDKYTYENVCGPFLQSVDPGTWRKSVQ